LGVLFQAKEGSREPEVRVLVTVPKAVKIVEVLFERRGLYAGALASPTFQVSLSLKYLGSLPDRKAGDTKFLGQIVFWRQEAIERVNVFGDSSFEYLANLFVERNGAVVVYEAHG